MIRTKFIMFHAHLYQSQVHRVVYKILHLCLIISDEELYTKTTTMTPNDNSWLDWLVLAYMYASFVQKNESMSRFEINISHLSMMQWTSLSIILMNKKMSLVDRQ